MIIAGLLGCATLCAAYEAWKSYGRLRDTKKVEVHDVPKCQEGDLVMTDVHVVQSGSKAGWVSDLNRLFPRFADDAVLAIGTIDFLKNEEDLVMIPVISSPVGFMPFTLEKDSVANSMTLSLGYSEFELGDAMGSLRNTQFLPESFGHVREGTFNTHHVLSVLSSLGYHPDSHHCPTAKVTLRVIKTNDKFTALGYVQKSKLRPIFAGPNPQRLLRRFHTPHHAALASFGFAVFTMQALCFQ